MHYYAVQISFIGHHRSPVHRPMHCPQSVLVASPCVVVGRCLLSIRAPSQAIVWNCQFLRNLTEPSVPESDRDLLRGFNSLCVRRSWDHEMLRGDIIPRSCCLFSLYAESSVEYRPVMRRPTDDFVGLDHDLQGEGNRATKVSNWATDRLARLLNSASVQLCPGIGGISGMRIAISQYWL